MENSFHIHNKDVSWDEARHEIYYRLDQYEKNIDDVKGSLGRIEDYFIKNVITMTEIKQSVKIWSMIFGAVPSTVSAICAIIVILLSIK